MGSGAQAFFWPPLGWVGRVEVEVSETQTQVAKPHPFDFDKLEKGMWIEAGELEEAARCKRTDPAFKLRVMGFRTAIEAKTSILSRVEGDRLRLMTDSEANVWTIGEAARGSRMLERNALRLVENIDTSKLSPAEQVVHEHASRTISAMAQAQRVEREKNKKLFSFVRGALPVGDDEAEDA